jgi:hypothetical protein
MLYFRQLFHTFGLRAERWQLASIDSLLRGAAAAVFRASESAPLGGVLVLATLPRLTREARLHFRRASPPGKPEKQKPGTPEGGREVSRRDQGGARANEPRRRRSEREKPE